MLSVNAIFELQLVTHHHRNVSILKGLRSVIISPVWFLFYCKWPTASATQHTFLFLIRTFLGSRQPQWLQLFPCDKANLRFPLSVCMTGCSKLLHKLPVSKTKPQHCNYSMTINRANQQLAQQHLNSTQSERAVWPVWKENKRKSCCRYSLGNELSAVFYIGGWNCWEESG